MGKQLNMIGRQVVKLRQQHGWTQQQLAVRLQFAGWHNATRTTVSKIEGRTMGIMDIDVCILAAALQVRHADIYPSINWQRPMDETIHQFIPQELHGFTPESD